MKLSEMLKKLRKFLNIATYSDINRLEGMLISHRSHNDYVDMEMDRLEKKINKINGGKK